MAGSYQPGDAFACLSGEGKVPYTALNDNYCDCLDGSDEPGTGACAGQDTTLFHCPNVGSTPRLVYASRVDDGICDCCDGSDEGGLAAKGRSTCVNHCVEEGEADRLERAKKIEMLQIGLTKKAEIEEKAKVDREALRAEIAKLQAELPALEAALELAEKADKEAKAAVEANAPFEKLEQQLSDLRELVVKQQEEIDKLRSEMDMIKKAAGLDESAEAAASAPPADAAASAPAKDEEKVVSEYAKWMDGAGDTPGAIKEDPMAGAMDPDDEEEVDDGPGPEVKTEPAKKAADEKTKEEKDLGEAKDKVRQNKDGSRSLKRKLERVSDDRLGFAGMADHCLEKSDGQYTYKICMFEDARQDHTSLGRWKGWSGPKEAKFENGQMCPGGPARELKVIFECGSEEEMHEVTEPSRCSYEARVSAPGACDAADAAALEKPPVKHPRTEL